MPNETIIDEYALCLIVSLAYMPYHDKCFEKFVSYLMIIIHDDLLVLKLFDFD